MVAAWISAETGVGPAMASGSQVCKKNWPDFDMTAASKHSEAMRSIVWLVPPLPSPRIAAALMSMMLHFSFEAKKRMIMPISRPISPTRLVRKALRAASELGCSSHQWPMSANEQTPTSSQPTIICSTFALVTKNNMAAVNSDKKPK